LRDDLLQDDLETVIEERPMPRTSRDTETGPTANPAKAQRERDQALAMQEYEAEQRAVRANMARLRELRLAREAAAPPATAAQEKATQATTTTSEPPKTGANRAAADRPARRKNAPTRRAPATRARSATGRTKR
jgi:hypothetical protein